MSFFLLILYLFCIFIRPQDWIPVFYGMSLVNALSLLTVFFIVVEQMSSKKIDFVKVPQNRLMIGLFACVMLSHITHTYFGGLMYAFTSFSVNVILFFILLNCINTERKFKIAIWLMIVMIFVLVPQGIYQLEYGYGWAGQSLTRHYDTFRINWVGIFNDPNDLALIFVIATGLTLAFVFGRTGFIYRNLSAVIIGFLLYGIYLTNSRGGLLALMVTIYFFFVKRTRRFFWGGIIGGLMAFLVLVFGPSRAGLITIDESSAYNRVELWYEGIQMIKANPFFGRGYNMFIDELAQTAHNSFILAGSELGFIGLFLWVALFYISYKGLSIIQANDHRLYNYALGLQSSLVGFSAAAFFLSRTYVILPYLLFALSGSLMHVAKQRNDQLAFNFTKKDFQMTFLLSVGILLLVYVVVKIGL